MKAGVPDWGMGVVDVRDLAEAHYRAAITPGAKGRHITSGHNSSFPELAKALREHYGDAYPFPKKALPKWLVWLVGPIMDKGMTRKMVSLNVNHTWRADNSKSVKELGMTYRPLAESIVDFFEQMTQSGLVPPAK